MNHINNQFYFELTNQSIKKDQLQQLCIIPKSGCILTFDGITRDNFENKQVQQLEFECDEQMCSVQLQEICQQLLNDYNDINYIVISHRLGIVPISESSLYCIISSKHRIQTFIAMESLVNQIKQKVPIWKKEIYNDNSSQWKENVEFYKN